jgi:hypothetical protein
MNHKGAQRYTKDRISRLYPYLRVPVRWLNGKPFSHGGKFLNARLAFLD